MLSAIYVKGFKTFARPVRMPLSGGITAIVGPNGSGKSNITDAILFALGEGSPSLLRAGSMDDVVFSGSESLPAAGAAEVTLVIDNGDGVVSLPYGEVSLTRRISRGGDTEYRINGSRARMADVRAVAGEAGIGRHSILRQGAVDAIVAGGAQACRTALEEAAGLGVFRRRRLAAGRKLDQTAAQLESGRALEAELAEQLRKIEREAVAAREYRELEARYRKLSLAHLYGVATRGLDGLRSRLAEAEATAARLVEEEGAAREQGRRHGEAEVKLEGELREVERLIEGLENGLERLRADASRAERSAFRAEGARDVDADRRRLVERIEGEIERVSAELGRLEEGVDGLEEGHARAKGELGRLEGLVSRTRREGSAATARRVEAAGNLRALRERRDRAASRLGETEAMGDEDLARLAEAREGLDALRSEPRVGASAVPERVRELRGLLRGRAADADSRRGVLASLVGRTEAEVRALRVPEGGSNGKRLYEVVRSRPGYEAAVEAALGDLAGGVIAPLSEGLRFLSGERPSERVVVRLDAGELAEHGTPPGKPLAECVEVLDPSYEEVASRLLAGIYVIDGVAEPGGSAPSNGHVAVTREGLRLTRTSASRTAEDGEFVREARLAEEEARLDVLKNRMGEELYDLREEVASHSGRLDELNARGEALRNLASRVTRAGRLLASEAERRSKGAERARCLRQEAEAALEGAEGEISTAEATLGEAEKAEQRAGEELSEAQRSVDPAYAATREAAGRLARSRSAIRALRDRRARLVRELGRLKKAAPAGRDQRLAELSRRAIGAASRLEAGGREGLGAARRARSEAAARRTRVSEERAELSRTAGELAVELARARSGVEAVREELVRVEEAAARASEEILEEWGATLEVARGEAEALGEPSEAERARLARRLKRFGDVNLLAISQQGDLEERYEFVSAQRADVEAAAEELEHVIRKLDGEMEERFTSTFRDVRRAFGEIVPRMMDGASGELTLSEEGVEVGLRLRRKGWRPLRVLSGGERSLLALSFLFSIFLSRPTPSGDRTGAFCVLDEAEAALDDVNLARFLSVVDSYRASGQFLLVTHQKRTMATADVLYGVTQDSSGATVVVSKRLTGE
ncbi:chromosome segregation protein SMC [Rubrobacter marinus]|uniref:Chromosome partition protein Smc n=1 Tax=Rubrobacter marinus TaxID=2653852 RepID=A0A6G8PXN0_9ACTN|nr:chromosome segregation protein SMC [Rubrobacter marinus]QIN78946.1 chromosome segregation protein SMC [Rubrobacter marinus]